MKYYDLHTHTTFSDGDFTPEDLIKITREKGHGLGISDHLLCAGMNTLADVERYLDTLERYDILRGCEANIGEDYTLPDRLAAKLDYVIASVHFAPDLSGGLIFLGDYFGERSGEGVTWSRPIDEARAEEYLEATLPMIEHTMATQRMDILGHCTVLPFCEILAETPFQRDWENAVLGLCKKYDVALEISTLWREPGLDMVRRAKEMGLRFALGSDCHHKGECLLTYSIETAERAGLCEEDFFLPTRG